MSNELHANSYHQTVDYLYSHLPMFTRIGAAALKKDLTNTLELCARIGNPQHAFRSIHIGGTNGKGSTSHMIAAILQTAGYKTGLYTSPHLLDFRERIRINGEMIPEEQVIRFVSEQKDTIEEIKPSFFEVTVAMAFDYFVAEKVDIAVIEVGLGGRLDSTNIITPLLSVVTNISYDHMNILGDSLQQIAYEKAGIIKPGIPIVVGEKQEETADIFISTARDVGAPLVFASDEWEISPEQSPSPEELITVRVRETIDNQSSVSFDLHLIQLDLTGSYQLKNLATVLSAVKQLNLSGFGIRPEIIETALRQVQSLTGLAGRWQTLGTNPLVIADTGHNEAGIREVVKNIRATPFKGLHMVIGMVKDKDSGRVLQLLPADAHYYFCSPAIERAKPAAELAGEARQWNLNGAVYLSVNEALSSALKNADPDDFIFIGGSTFVVSEAVESFP